MTFDLASPLVLRDPYPTYARARREPAIPTVNLPGYGTDIPFITRYQDVNFVLKDPRFVNDMRKVPGKVDLTKKWYIPSVLKSFLNSMALQDDPDHARLRTLVHKAFTPAMIQKLDTRVDQIANELLDQAAKKPVIDFVADFALPLPLTVIGEMMGVSASERVRFRRYMANQITDISLNNPVQALGKLRNTFGLNSLLKGLIRDRRRHPQDDLASALVQAHEDSDRLSEDELVAMLFLILFAGHETTVNLLGNGTLALLQNPDQFEKLKANPDLLDSAIEEMLRYCSPVHQIAPRFALEEVQIGDGHIPQYSTVAVGIAAANRDESVFDHPDQFDIARSPNRHIAFGFGIHFCLGAPLARLEAKGGFGVLLKRFPNLQLAAPVESLAYKGGPALRGLVSFPMRLNG